MKSTIHRARRIVSLGTLCSALTFAAACSRSSDDPLERIRDLHARSRFEDSLEPLRALMDEDPTDPEVNYLFGVTLMHTGDPSLAIWPLQRSAKSPDFAFDSGMLLAHATVDSRTPEDAIDAVDIALAVQPDNVEALALRARANLKASRPADALADIERAAELDSSDPEILVPHVLALLAFDRVDEAEAALDARGRSDAIAEDPLDEQIQARLCLTNAAFAFEEGDRKSAEVLYGDCLDAYPVDPLVVSHAVEFYDRIGQRARATELLQLTFEVTRAPHFGYALTRRVRRLSEAEEPRAPSERGADEHPSQKSAIPVGEASV